MFENGAFRLTDSVCLSVCSGVGLGWCVRSGFSIRERMLERAVQVDAACQVDALCVDAVYVKSRDVYR